jgi:hypothetical protein
MPSWTNRASRCSTTWRRRRTSPKAALRCNSRACCSEASCGWTCTVRPPRPRVHSARSGHAAQTSVATRTAAGGSVAAVLLPLGRVVLCLLASVRRQRPTHIYLIGCEPAPRVPHAQNAATSRASTLSTTPSRVTPARPGMLNPIGGHRFVTCRQVNDLVGRLAAFYTDE